MEYRCLVRVFRPPNLLTIPGDVVVGFSFAVSSGGIVYWRAGPCFAPVAAIGVSLLVYAAGLALNDYFDREIDALERPGRPIPSGGVRPGHVLSAAVLLLAFAMPLSALSAGFFVYLLLVPSVILYNAFSKRSRILGPLNMGFCRFLNVMLGVSCIYASARDVPVQAFSAAAMIGGYITAVSFLACRETERCPGAAAFLPVPVCVAGFAVLLLPVAGAGAAAPASAAAATALVAYFSVKLALTNEVASVPELTGGLIRALIPLQAALVLISGASYALAAVTLVLMWVLSTLLGRRFYSS